MSGGDTLARIGIKNKSVVSNSSPVPRLEAFALPAIIEQAK